MFDTSDLLKVEPIIEYLKKVDKTSLINLLSEYNKENLLKILKYL